MTSQQLLAIVAGAAKTPEYVCLTYHDEDDYLETVGVIADVGSTLGLDVVTGRVDIGFTPNPEGDFEATWVYSGGTEPQHRILTLGGPRGVFTSGRMVGTPIERLAAVSPADQGMSRLVQGREIVSVESDPCPGCTDHCGQCDRYTVTEAGKAALDEAA